MANVFNHPPSPGRINCHGCRRENVEVECGRCGRCRSCGCRCRVCVECTKIKGMEVTHSFEGDFCRICRKCTKTCKCRKSPNWLPIPPNLHFPTKRSKLLRPLGVEVEILNCASMEAQRLDGLLTPPEGMEFTFVRDGSLSRGGREIVVGPLWGDGYLEGMEWLGKQFSIYNCGVDGSCGFHVHVGGGDLSAFDLRRVMGLYLKVQKDFYSLLVEEGRREGRFCKPYPFSTGMVKKMWACKTSQEIKRWFIEWMYPSQRMWNGREIMGLRRSEKISKVQAQKRLERAKLKSLTETENFPTLKAHKYEAARYFGLNFHTFMQRKTVEFRHHAGTVKGEEMVGWGLFCGWMVEIASLLSDQEVREVGGLKELVSGIWKKPYRLVQFPLEVREWVLEEMERIGG